MVGCGGLFLNTEHFSSFDQFSRAYFCCTGFTGGKVLLWFKQGSFADHVDVADILKALNIDEPVPMRKMSSSSVCKFFS
jgi:hypothetical protein